MRILTKPRIKSLWPKQEILGKFQGGQKVYGGLHDVTYFKDIIFSCKRSKSAMMNTLFTGPSHLPLIIQYSPWYVAMHHGEVDIRQKTQK